MVGVDVIDVDVIGEGEAAQTSAVAVAPTENNKNNNNHHHNKNKDDNDVVGMGVNVKGVAALTTAAAVAPTGGESVQGAWRAYAMAAVALFLIVTGVGAYLLARSVNPLIHPLDTPSQTHPLLHPLSKSSRYILYNQSTLNLPCIIYPLNNLLPCTPSIHLFTQACYGTRATRGGFNRKSRKVQQVPLFVGDQENGHPQRDGMRSDWG